MSDPAAELFREEALTRLRRGDLEGKILQLSPEWLNWSYRLVLLLAFAGVTFVAAATISEYAVGPAVVRIDGRTDVASPGAGVIERVVVQPGQKVTRGQVLLRLRQDGERRDLERTARELDGQLLRVLRDPSDQVARSSLGTLQAQKGQAEARLAERIVRAPRDGVVSDIRIRAAQPIAAGETLCTLTGDDTRMSVVALLPGQTRPLLKPGMLLRLEIAGFRYSFKHLEIVSVGDEVVGPAEVRRYLGPDLADSVTLSGPTVIVRARLAERQFDAEGHSYNFYSGSPASAYVRLRDRSLLVTLLPWLKVLVGADRG